MCHFPAKLFNPFPLIIAKLISDKSLDIFDLSPLQSALPAQDLNIHKSQSIAGNDTSAPIYWWNDSSLLE
jgi:hypothetical protein